MKKKPSLSALTSASRCAIYCRFSDQDADSKGAFSTNDAQEAASRRFIEQSGASLVEVYTDESKTGTNLKRPGWRKLLAGAQEGRFDTVVVTYTDRLARGEQFTIASYLLGQLGVAVVCSIEQFGEGLAGIMQRQMSMMISGIWPAITAEKTLAKLSEMARAGYWVGGRRQLFGHKAVPVAELATGRRIDPSSARTREGSNLRLPKRLVVDEEEAAAVREAFAVFVATNSMRSAGDVLVQASGRAWPDHAIRNLLNSHLVVGELHWGEIINPAFCPPIVDRAVWEAAQRLLEGRKRGTSRPRKSADETLGETLYLLGIAYCACGRRMTMYGAKNNVGRRYNYYRCPARKEGLCDLGDVSAARLHKAVIGELLALAHTPWRLRVLLAEASKTYGDTGDIERELAASRRRVKALDTQESKLAQAVGLASPEAIPALTNQLGKLAMESRQTRIRMEALEGELAQSRQHKPDRAFLENILGKLSQAWDMATEQERRELASLLIEKVEVKATGLEVWLLEAAQGESSSGGKFNALYPAGTLTIDQPRRLTFKTDVRSPRAHRS